MARHSNRLSTALLLASALALILPVATADAAHFGGGGGGARGGGGGGGMHVGGGGGGMHFGGGGGGFHLGGGGGMHFGGGGFHLGGGSMHLGGLRLGGGGMHFGGLRSGGGGLRFGGLRSSPRGLNAGLQGPRSFTRSARLGSVDRGTAGLVGGTGLNRGGVGNSGNSNLENRNFGNRNLANSDLRNRNLVTGGLAGRNSFARNSLAGSNPTWRNGFDHTNFHRLGEGDRFGRFGDRDRFDRFNGSGNAFFGGFGGGWAGPVFWPYAYTDIYCGAFWDCGYGAPFWDYGYGDIYGAMFWPFAYDLLASYLPALTSGYGYGGYGGYGGAAYASNGYRHASRTYARSDTGALPSPDQRAQMCGQDTRDVVGLPSDQIQELISPTPDQQAALNDFINASVAAAQTIKSACPTAIPFTPTGRLEAMEQRMGAMAQAVSVLQGPLDRFWNTLSDEQKARLSTAGTAQDQQHAQQNTNGQRSVALGCNAATTATQWPGSLIEKAVHPDALQQAKLDALKQAGDQAADELANACPSELPSTPPDRLVAIGKRLEVMKRTVSSVRVALADFYRSLSDEQKAQFNTIGGQRTARRQG